MPTASFVTAASVWSVGSGPLPRREKMMLEIAYDRRSRRSYVESLQTAQNIFLGVDFISNS